MQSKKKKILEAAVRLFARQGYHATSIQEIVNEVGMAKGSIYFYFKSKEELLVSIFEYYGEQMNAGMAEYPGEGELIPKERLRLQLERQIRFLKDNAEFIHVMIKEPIAGPQQEQIRKLAFRFRSRYLLWLYAHIQAIYGPQAERYRADGVLLLGGMMNQFMEGVLIDRDTIDDARLAAFLVRRLDDVMQGMQKAGESPIMGEAGIRRMIAFGMEDGTPDRGEAALADLIRHVHGTEAEETAAMLAAELNKPVPNRVVARALHALLEKQAAGAWREPLEHLAKVLEAL